MVCTLCADPHLLKRPPMPLLAGLQDAHTGMKVYPIKDRRLNHHDDRRE